MRLHCQGLKQLLIAVIGLGAASPALGQPGPAVRQAEPSTPPRAIYAHYMGCFPAGAMATAQLYREQATSLDPRASSSMLAMQGGRINNWPLVPQEWIYQREDLRRSLELEIRRAMRIGIDGFSIDAWAGGENAKRVFELMLEICKEKQLPFTVTLCLDPSCLAAKTERYDDTPGGREGALLDTVRYLLQNYSAHPNLARRNGKPLIFTYQTRSFLTPEARTLGGGKTEPARWKNFLLTLDRLRRMAKSEFDTDLYIHFDLDYAFGGIDYKELKGARLPHEPGPIIGDLAAYLSAGEGALKGFDAVGGFIGENWEPEYELVARKIKTSGGEWASPLWHQYDNKQGALHVKPGTDQLRQAWERIRASDSSLLQYVTWNDYGENTTLAPGTDTRYTIYDLTGYQIAWWKNGKPPAVDHDKLYLIYRHYPAAASVYPFHARRSAEGVLEVATILTQSAIIKLPGRAAEYEAPAGLFTKQFPLTPGPVAAQVFRGGAVALDVRSPEPISDKPWREANGMVCYSSEFERQWQLDFPGTPPQTFAEYGDADGDGLPNWFEMLWFGKFGDFTTATAADPTADPDGDGLTNLQEYQQQSDPLRAAKAYEPGFVWDLASVHQSGISFNPDPDAAGRRVWRYLYKVGDSPVPLDGDYKPTPVAAGKVPYAGEMSHHLPANDHKYKSQAYGWIARHKNADTGAWMLQLRPGVNSVAILAWESPVTGTVAVELSTAARPDKAFSNATLTIQQSAGLKTLKQCEVKGDQAIHENLPAVEVLRGDRLYFIASGRQNSDVMLDALKIQLLSVK